MGVANACHHRGDMPVLAVQRLAARAKFQESDESRRSMVETVLGFLSPVAVPDAQAAI